jgi:hypothetical protein
MLQNTAFEAKFVNSDFKILKTTGERNLRLQNIIDQVHFCSRHLLPLPS